MGVTSTIKRRILGRLHPLFKRLMLPACGLLIVVHIATWSDSSLPEAPEIHRVLPGEALDPLVKPKIHNPHDKRPSNAFESVLRSAAEVEDLQGPDDDAPVVSLTKKITPSDTRRNKGFQKNEETLQVEAPKGEDDKMKKVKRESDDLRDSEWSMSKMNISGNEKVKFPGHKISEDTVTLTVMSSADKVFMSINKREIYRGLTQRGMHVVVLHQHTGKSVAARVFDTFNNGTEEEMVAFLDDIQSGRIVVFAIRDEAATGLTWKGRNKLREMGSRFADRINFRDMWILVTIKGGLKLAESFSNVAVEDTAYEWGGPLFLRTDFDLEATAGLCPWGKSDHAQLRQRFCQRFDGYGDLCKCSVKNFEDVFFKTDPQVFKDLEGNPFHKELAVAVLASDRPHYLYRTLKALREAGGEKNSRIVVLVEKEHREIAALTKIFGYHLIVTGQRPGENVTVPVRVRDKVQYAFRELMGASFPANTIPEGMKAVPSIPTLRTDYLVILEDDMEVSLDFFKYLHNLAPVLKKDETVAGITAFNFNSYNSAADSLVDFYRTDRLQALALLVPSRTLHEYLIPGWPTLESPLRWHSGLQRELDKKTSLSIIYPEISRCRHFGYSGHQIHGSLQKAFFDTHRISLTTSYEIPKQNIERLELTSYDQWQLQTIKNSKPVSFNFCKYAYPYGEDPIVVYVEYDGNMDNDKQLLALLKCFGAWHLYAEGEWRRTWHLRYNGHPVTVVAVPASPYSNLKPADYKMEDMTKEKQEGENI